MMVTIPNGQYRAQNLYRLAGALELVKEDLRRSEGETNGQAH